jgi:hypothetical protein
MYPPARDVCMTDSPRSSVKGAARAERNIGLLGRVHEDRREAERGETIGWADDIERELLRAAGKAEGGGNDPGDHGRAGLPAAGRRISHEA